MSIIFTIGYEGTDINRFISTLRLVGVERIADVRAIAISRKKGFSKRALSDRLAANAIAYSHFTALGDPKSGRDAAKAGHYQKFYDIYSSHLRTTQAQSSLDELVAWISEAPTCLLCYERDPKNCHRTIVAREISALGFQVFDLFADDPKRYVRHSAKLPRFYTRQGIAAA